MSYGGGRTTPLREEAPTAVVLNLISGGGGHHDRRREAGVAPGQVCSCKLRSEQVPSWNFTLLVKFAANTSDGPSQLRTTITQGDGVAVRMRSLAKQQLRVCLMRSESPPLTLKPECDVCGLDYSFADPADGPAFLVVCFMCVPAVAVASWIEIAYEPALWVHLVTSIPLILLACIPPLRPLKDWLVNSQFFFKAAEGQIDLDYVRPLHRPPENGSG